MSLAGIISTLQDSRNDLKSAAAKLLRRSGGTRIPNIALKLNGAVSHPHQVDCTVSFVCYS